MNDSAALLVEIGTEELPPLSLTALSEAFVTGLVAELETLGLAPEGAQRFASPRRLAILIERVAARQADSRQTLKGPPTRIALGDDGTPGPAALAFAEKCGVAFADLGRVSDKKGEYLALTRDVTGEPLATLLEGAIGRALANLPVARPMRWGEGQHEFVRPVHWLTALHGDDVVPVSLFGLESGRITYGHRFHAPGPIELATAADYAPRLASDGWVLADPRERHERIEAALAEVLAARGADSTIDAELLDEVNALVEWPVAIVGTFDAAFLRLPREVLISTLQKHQRYFPVTGADGALKAEFITISNLDSREPQAVARGNERVVTPRLADAAFFYDADIRTPLAERVAALDAVVFETRLGSLGDKTRRVVALTTWLAEHLCTDSATATRAALLSRADLTTDMVGEFPDLQGIMGRYYAQSDGEDPAVAEALGDFYRPAFAGDAIPSSEPGRIVALADRADTLAGVFAAGKRPKGNKDPFGLRRAALGLCRIAIEGQLDFGLDALFAKALTLQPVDTAEGLGDGLYDFAIDRLRAQLTVRPDVTAEIFDAVAINRPSSLVDFLARLEAVVAFASMDEAEELAAANKRIANLLRKSELPADAAIDGALFESDAEHQLHRASETVSTVVGEHVEAGRYTEALRELAALRDGIDRYFDEVMVMADDSAVRTNRLAQLASIRSNFLEVADISVLSRARG